MSLKIILHYNQKCREPKKIKKHSIRQMKKIFCNIQTFSDFYGDSLIESH